MVTQNAFKNRSYDIFTHLYTDGFSRMRQKPNIKQYGTTNYAITNNVPIMRQYLKAVGERELVI